MRRLVGDGGPASASGRVQQSVIGRAGAIGREGAMLDTKVGTTVSRVESRQPLSEVNRKSGIKSELCASERAFLKHICRAPIMIDPDQPFPSQAKRQKILVAMGIEHTLKDIVYYHLRTARRKERIKRTLKSFLPLPNGRGMGSKWHGALGWPRHTTHSK